jgi:hypothetical protein
MSAPLGGSRGEAFSTIKRPGPAAPRHSGLYLSPWLALSAALVVASPLTAVAQEWHLLLPPRDIRGWTDLRAPLNRWVKIDSYAAVSGCRADRERRLADARAAVKELLRPDPARAAMLGPESPDPGWKKKYYRLWGDIGRLSVGRCVSAADPAR